MTLHNRHLPNHRLVHRQKNGGIFDDVPGNGNGNGNGNGSSSTSENGSSTQPTTPPTSPSPSSTSKPSTPPAPSTTKPHQPTNTSTNEPEPTTNDPNTEATPTMTSTSTSSSTESSSTSSTSSTTSTSKSIPAVTITGPPVIKTSTSASGFSLPSSAIPSSTPSPSQTSTPSSGTSVGTIIGGVVGGIAAIAIIGIIASFILRRLRRRRELDEFNSDDFVRPPNLSEPEFQRSSTFDPHPPNMAQLNRGEIVSTYSSPGMAGHGAYAYDQSQALASAGGTTGGLQERSNYVYGQGYDGDDNASDHAHGVYSSQPMAQASYNPEVYGSYAYSNEGNYATPGGHASYPNEPQHGYARGGDDDFAPLASPYDSAPPAGSAASHPPALFAGAPAVAAGRGTNTRSVYEEDDAYGGI